MIKTVAIETVVLKPELQCREKVDQEVVIEYSQAIKAGEAIPPVMVIAVGDEYILVDGFQRHAGTILANKPRITIDVKKGTWEEAVRAACAANAKHGVRRTKNDMVRALHLAEKTFKELAIKDVAAIVGVSTDWAYRHTSKPKAKTKPTKAEAAAKAESAKATAATQEGPKQEFEGVPKKVKPAAEKASSKAAEPKPEPAKESNGKSKALPEEESAVESKTAKPCIACGSEVFLLSDAGWMCEACEHVEGEPLAEAQAPVSNAKAKLQTAMGKFVREVEKLGYATTLAKSLEALVKEIAKVK
jgi:hypothetical protein